MKVLKKELADKVEGLKRVFRILEKDFGCDDEYETSGLEGT